MSVGKRQCVIAEGYLSDSVHATDWATAGTMTTSTFAGD